MNLLSSCLWLLLSAKLQEGTPSPEIFERGESQAPGPRTLSISGDFAGNQIPPPPVALSGPGASTQEFRECNGDFPIFTPFRRAATGGQESPPERLPEPTPHGSISGFFERHGSATAWRHYVWEDELTQPQILLPIGLALSALAVRHWDLRLEKQWQGLLGGRQTYSNVSQDVLVISSALSGVLFPGEGRNSWDELWTQGEAFGTTSLTVFVGKVLVSRPRPGRTPTNGSGSYSFPSGHSGAAFTSATLIERNSGLLAGIPAYALAGFTAFERVEAGRHFPSDVLAGAAIGCLSAGIVDSLHWGSGPGRGIVPTAPNLSIGFVERLHGIQLDWEISF